MSESVLPSIVAIDVKTTQTSTDVFGRTYEQDASGSGSGIIVAQDSKNIYIANIVKCRPPENRDPAPEESAACLPWLRMQFRLLRPKIVVCLGRIAAQQMIGKDFSVTRDHGKFFDKQGTLFMATLHPAALLRNPKSKISAFEDFVALREKIEQVCDHTYNRS